jgi:hypothetical protein
MHVIGEISESWIVEAEVLLDVLTLRLLYYFHLTVVSAATSPVRVIAAARPYRWHYVLEIKSDC